MPPAAGAAQRTSFSKLFDEIGTVDQVGIEERVAKFTTRSIKKGSKLWGLKTAVSMVDLTTLEGKDTPGKVASLCQKARRPSADPDVPPVAAVCIYPFLVKHAARWLADTAIKVASVATAFPSGQSPLALRLEEVRTAVSDGADEIDMVINRGVFLAGEHARIFDEIAATKEACGSAHLKVILETGELQTYDNVRIASDIAMRAGADFIKTSTGKVVPAATPPVVLVMLQAVRDFHELTGREVGVKPAGGMRTAKEAIRYLVMVHEEAGARWLTPNLFRFGASSLLNDILMQRRKQASGHYASSYDVTLD